MRNYLHNLLTWLRGYRRADEITFKPGWSANWRWWALYTFDYGTHVASGGAVVSWSRWFFMTRRKYRVSAFFNRLLQHLDKRHGEESGTVLWRTVDCSWPVRLGIAVVVIAVVVLL
ncbi:MAG TPA: hypothetical protein VM238_04390 [Phycisphaerae bacterium]|nr:hypothetical protein [Phycisphaerae bacterium]